MTEDDILQISNDISEDMLSPKVTKAELVEVIKFWQRNADKKQENITSIGLDLCALVLKISQ